MRARARRTLLLSGFAGLLVVSAVPLRASAAPGLGSAWFSRLQSPEVSLHQTVIKSKASPERQAEIPVGGKREVSLNERVVKVKASRASPPLELPAASEESVPLLGESSEGRSSARELLGREPTSVPSATHSGSAASISAPFYEGGEQLAPASPRAGPAEERQESSLSGAAGSLMGAPVVHDEREPGPPPKPTPAPRKEAPAQPQPQPVAPALSLEALRAAEQERAALKAQLASYSRPQAIYQALHAPASWAHRFRDRSRWPALSENEKEQLLRARDTKYYNLDSHSQDAFFKEQEIAEKKQAFSKDVKEAKADILPWRVAEALKTASPVAFLQRLREPWLSQKRQEGNLTARYARALERERDALQLRFLLKTEARIAELKRVMAKRSWQERVQLALRAPNSFLRRLWDQWQPVSEQRLTAVRRYEKYYRASRDLFDLPPQDRPSGSLVEHFGDLNHSTILENRMEEALVLVSSLQQGIDNRSSMNSQRYKREAFLEDLKAGDGLTVLRMLHTLSHTPQKSALAQASARRAEPTLDGVMKLIEDVRLGLKGRMAGNLHEEGSALRERIERQLEQDLKKLWTALDAWT